MSYHIFDAELGRLTKREVKLVLAIFEGRKQLPNSVTPSLLWKETSKAIKKKRETPLPSAYSRIATRG